MVNDCGRLCSRDVLLRGALLAPWPLEGALAGKRSPPKIHDPVRQVVCGAPPGRKLVSSGVPQGSREALAVSPGTVSQHLARLRGAGLVEPHRRGRRVYYRLSLCGEQLLDLFGELDDESPQG